MAFNRLNSARNRAGFTLVEILIVIVIIGLLAGMTTTVVVSARRSVNNSVITTQMAQLSMALDEYKNRYGEYPPDLSDQKAVERHIRKRWPRYGVSYDQFLNHVHYGCLLSSQDWNKGDSLSDLSALSDCGRYDWILADATGPVGSYVSSLVFWLGGLPGKDGVPRGFYASPTCPLGISKDDKPIGRPARAKREEPLFAFEKKTIGAFMVSTDAVGNVGLERVEDVAPDPSTGLYQFIPGFCQGDYPVLYFRPTSGNGYETKTVGFIAEGLYSCAKPYAQYYENGLPLWFEDKRFQLVHPGADGLFDTVDSGVVYDRTAVRTVKQEPRNVSPADADNLTNFLENGTLESLYE